MKTKDGRIINERSVLVMSDKTRQYCIVLVVTVGVLMAVVAFTVWIYALVTGLTTMDPTLKTSLNSLLFLVITLIGVWVNGLYNRKHNEDLQRTTQQIVHEETAGIKHDLANGFGIKIGGVAGNIAADKVTDAVLPIALENKANIAELKQGQSDSKQATQDIRDTQLSGGEHGTNGNV